MNSSGGGSGKLGKPRRTIRTYGLGPRQSSHTTGNSVGSFGLLASLKHRPASIAAIVGLCLFLLFVSTPSLFSGGKHSHIVRKERGEWAKSSHGASDASLLRYAVVVDAGSTGSRVHAYRFLSESDTEGLTLIDDGFRQLKPGLSHYASSPHAGATSLKPLLDQALTLVPASAHSSTCMELRATAGLRLLPGNQAFSLLTAVRDYFSSLPFKSSPSSVSIMDGSDEGAYAWVTINYLTGLLGEPPSSTTATLDLGGGSVQLAYAMEEGDAAKAPDGYVRTMKGGGRSYPLYVYSYLGFGLMAARAAVLQHGDATNHPCILSGSSTAYEYTGKTYGVMRRDEEPAEVEACRAVILDILQLEKGCREETGCTFAGVWGGGEGNGGGGRRSIKLLSYFFDRAIETGIVRDANATVAPVSASSFLAKAREICPLPLSLAKKRYPLVDHSDISFLCFDLLYQHTLLTKGLKLVEEGGEGEEEEEGGGVLELVKQIEYQGTKVEAGWALGAALNTMSDCSR